MSEGEAQLQGLAAVQLQPPGVTRGIKTVQMATTAAVSWHQAAAGPTWQALRLAAVRQAVHPEFMFQLQCRLQLDSCLDQACTPSLCHAAHLLGGRLLRSLFGQAPPPQQQHRNQDEYAQHHSCHHPDDDAHYLARVAAAACTQAEWSGCMHSLVLERRHQHSMRPAC